MRIESMCRGFSPRGILVALGGLLLATVGCSGDPPPADPAPRAVRSTVVENAKVTRSRTFSGTSRASQQSRLSFKVGGTVTELPVSPGDRLRRGQLVARIDPFQYELEVERAEADLLRARASERNAQSTYERTKELYADNNASRGDLDSTRANAESAKAQTRSAEKMVELSRLQVSYTELRAREDCSVASVDSEVNENVGTGATVATVNCGDSIEVEVAIPESLIGQITEGMLTSVLFAAKPGETFSGNVTEVGVAAGGGGATFPVKISINGGHSELRTGLAAEVRFDFAQPAGVLTVPLSAVVQGTEGTFVFTAEPLGDAEGQELLARVSRRAVEVGELTADGLEVVSGLVPGDRVITAGLSSIYDGLEVRLATGGSNGAPAPGTNPAGQG